MKQTEGQRLARLCRSQYRRRPRHRVRCVLLSSGQVLTDAFHRFFFVDTVRSNADFRTIAGREQQNTQNATRIGLDSVRRIGAEQNDGGLELRGKLNQPRGRACMESQTMPDDDLPLSHGCLGASSWLAI